MFGATMPRQPALPKGFKRWPSNRKISPVARKMAVTYLSVVPMGGYKTEKDSDGTTIAAFKDWHFDNHPDTSRKPFWHPGISMLVSTAPAAKPKLTYADIPWAPMSYTGEPSMYSGWG